MSDELRFYAVRNAEGKWFRRKGYGGYGDTWVTELTKARVYTKPGGARTVSGFFAKHYPEYGVPSIVVFRAVVEEVLDESERVRKAQERERTRKARSDKLRAEQELRHAQENLERAKERLERAAR